MDDVTEKCFIQPQLDLDIKFNSKGVMITEDMFFILDQNKLIFYDWVNGFKMEFSLQDKSVLTKPKFMESKFRIDCKQDNQKEEKSNISNKMNNNMETIIKTIPIKEFALNKIINIVNSTKGNNKPLVSVEPESN